MKAIETTGVFDKDGNLTLDIPFSLREQKVKPVILIPEQDDNKAWLKESSKSTAFDFLAHPEEDIYSLQDDIV